MSNTIIDMPKVAQMLDAGWTVRIIKGGMAGYVAVANHDNRRIWYTAKLRCLEQVLTEWEGTRAEALELNDLDFDEPGQIDTEDFTPEQALTRLAYKIHGEILV